MSIYKGNNLIAGSESKGPKGPDWDRGEYISNPGDRTYIVPESGIVYVSDAIAIASNRVAMLLINEHVAATMGSGNSYVSSGPFPVNKGDVVKTNNLGSRPTTELVFVPWKA